MWYFECSGVPGLRQKIELVTAVNNKWPSRLRGICASPHEIQHAEHSGPENYWLAPPDLSAASKLARHLYQPFSSPPCHRPKYHEEVTNNKREKIYGTQNAKKLWILFHKEPFAAQKKSQARCVGGILPLMQRQLRNYSISMSNSNRR